jgi:hypothetical protein
MWKLLNNKGIWANTINAIYGSWDHIMQHHKDSNIWKEGKFNHLFDINASITWLPHPNCFTVKSAWNAIR